MSRRQQRYSNQRDWISQEVLDLFSHSFESTFALGNELHTQIQAVKADLYDRDYLQAFGSQENLNAYVVRWSPSRALAYSSIVGGLEPIKQLMVAKGESNEPVRTMCIGGGAGAEIVALGSIALLRTPRTKFDVLAVDIADWHLVIEKITGFVAENWYKSAGAEYQSLEDALLALSLSGSPFSVKFVNHDILTLPDQEMNLENMDFITSMFTTNELFAEKKAETVRFLLNLSKCKTGTLLLIVESAGSYSEIQIGSKTFPVQFLINHTLTQNNSWELLEGEDSAWYRVPKELKYALQLENMRCFYRLYRRT